MLPDEPIVPQRAHVSGQIAETGKPFCAFSRWHLAKAVRESASRSVRELQGIDLTPGKTNPRKTSAAGPGAPAELKKPWSRADEGRQRQSE
jgi:hypothetical protein